MCVQTVRAHDTAVVFVARRNMAEVARQLYVVEL